MVVSRVSAALFLNLLIVSACFCDATSAHKQLVKRPKGTPYKTVLSFDAGGLRGLLSVMVAMEIESAIRDFIYANPEFLPYDGLFISSKDDFDVNLVDFFDGVTGVSAGSWNALYFSSRGGNGAVQALLDQPHIREKYGNVSAGSAAGLSIWYKEIAPQIYSLGHLAPERGVPLNLSNPRSPGVLSPLLPTEQFSDALRQLLGTATLADLDTTTLVPVYDLISRTVVLFVKDSLRDPPIVATAKLLPRHAPKGSKEDSTPFDPDLEYSADKNYYAADVAMASSTLPAFFPATELRAVGSNETEFLAIDGVLPLETTTLSSALLIAGESGEHSFERIAIIGIGAGEISVDEALLANAGLAGWIRNNALSALTSRAGLRSLNSLIDYLFYSNPATKPYQYLRIQRVAPLSTEDGRALAEVQLPEFLDKYEEIGRDVAQEFREAIDVFVKDFIFGYET